MEDIGFRLIVMLAFFLLIFINLIFLAQITRSVYRFFAPKLQFDFLDYSILTAQVFGSMMLIPTLIVVYRWLL
jgi:hypothetical protein